jgi:ABC-type molybdate transport system substrate-binding protein
VVASVLLGACGSGGSDNDAKTPGPGTVYTPVQLENITNELIDRYQESHPDAKLKVVTESSVGLSRTIALNTPGVAILPIQFVPAPAGRNISTVGRSLLVLVVPDDNPRNITTYEDFRSTPIARKSGCVVYMKPDCGTVVPEAVADGKLDAALMWRSELKVPAGVKVIDIPPQPNIVINIAGVVTGTDPDAVGFGKFLKTDTARSILTKNGYLP